MAAGGLKGVVGDVFRLEAVEPELLQAVKQPPSPSGLGSEPQRAA